jgi:hypothetical protein
MKALAAVLAIAALLLLGFALVRRARVQPEVADTARLEAAINGYLAEKSMGMKVASFEELDIQGDRATAVCRMQEATGLYGGIAVRWEFDLRLARRGGWQVEEHRAP